jgi:hypothetical protein
MQQDDREEVAGEGVYGLLLCRDDMARGREVGTKQELDMSVTGRETAIATLAARREDNVRR